jgi:hypothetical protein
MSSGLRKVSLAVFVGVMASALAACGKGDCTVNTCNAVCTGAGSFAPEPERTIEDCVQHETSDGADLKLYDEEGEEVFSCRTVIQDDGLEYGTCSLDYDVARVDHCGCGETYSTVSR